MTVQKVKNMTIHRKLRKSFDYSRQYSVDVSTCTQKEKKEVQDAFFDVGILWKHWGDEYQHLYAAQYSNSLSGSKVVTCQLMYSDSTCGCNMTTKEFLELVYEPEPESRGHVHAENMALFAEDAKTHAEPWKLWEFKGGNSVWRNCKLNPVWDTSCEYRRKTKTHIVNGVEIPDLRVSPELGDHYYLADPTASELTDLHTFVMKEERLWAERGLCYEPTEEGKQAAILHTKAMLGIE